MSSNDIALKEAQLKGIFNSLHIRTKINNSSDTHKHFRALALRHTFETNGFAKRSDENAESFIARYNVDFWKVDTFEDMVISASSQLEMRNYFAVLSRIQPKDELLAKVLKKDNSRRGNLFARAIKILKKKT